MLPVGNIEMVIFYMFNFYTHGCNVFSCNNVFYTLWYHFYTHGCDAFTCKNVLYTRWYVFYSHEGNVFIHTRMFCTPPHITSIPVGVMYLHAGTFCTLSDTILYPLRAPIFTVITEVWVRANRAVVTNNLTVIIEVELIECFLYCCALRLWSQICVTCWSCWFPDLVALPCAWAGCLGPEGRQHTYEMDIEHFTNPSLSVGVAKILVFRVLV